ncbi:MAG: hypothetical protein SVJ22_04795 [Halobacteriota archaeon]|nr:hypothetical protein [Halobacteriota archaeon]
MKLKLEVKKLEGRRVKNTFPPIIIPVPTIPEETWVCGINQNFFSDMIDGCFGFDICQN